MSTDEERLRAQLEEEMRRITVDDLLVQTVVSLINLAGRKGGLAPGTEAERDLEQVKTAIDAVTALLPLLERHGPEAIKPIRDALAQLQLAYARGTQDEAEGGGEKPPEDKPKPEETGGPAQSSGRLWVPGQ